MYPIDVDLTWYGEKPWSLHRLSINSTIAGSVLSCPIISIARHWGQMKDFSVGHWDVYLPGVSGGQSLVRAKRQISIEGCLHIGALVGLTTMCAQDSGRVFKRQRFDDFANHIAARIRGNDGLFRSQCIEFADYCSLQVDVLRNALLNNPRSEQKYRNA